MKNGKEILGLAILWLAAQNNYYFCFGLESIIGPILYFCLSGLKTSCTTQNLLWIWGCLFTPKKFRSPRDDSFLGSLVVCLALKRNLKDVNGTLINLHGSYVANVTQDYFKNCIQSKWVRRHKTSGDGASQILYLLAGLPFIFAVDRIRIISMFTMLQAKENHEFGVRLVYSKRTYLKFILRHMKVTWVKL